MKLHLSITARKLVPKEIFISSDVFLFSFQIIFAVKPMKPSGLLFLMSGEDFQSFIAVTIDMRNIVFCLRYESFYEERKVPFSDFSNGWLYMKLDKSKEKGLRFSVNGGKKQMINPFVQNYSLARISNSFKCHGDVFFGSIPKTLKVGTSNNLQRILFFSSSFKCIALKIDHYYFSARSNVMLLQ